MRERQYPPRGQGEQEEWERNEGGSWPREQGMRGHAGAQRSQEDYAREQQYRGQESDWQQGGQQSGRGGSREGWGQQYGPGSEWQGQGGQRQQEAFQPGGGQGYGRGAEGSYGGGQQGGGQYGGGQQGQYGGGPGERWGQERYGGMGGREAPFEHGGGPRGFGHGESVPSSARGQWGEGGRAWRYGEQGYGGGQAGEGLGQRQRKGPKGYTRSDERIREFICERLTEYHQLDVSEVSVNVKEGEVTLEGTVPERFMKYQIEDVADSCWGVKDVDNRLRVSSGTEAGGAMHSAGGQMGSSERGGSPAGSTQTGGASRAGGGRSGGRSEGSEESR